MPPTHAGSVPTGWKKRKNWRRRRERDISDGMTDLAAPVSLDLTQPTAIHLDAVGGVSGDMFVAALLDARPDLTAACLAAVEAAKRAMRAPEGAAVQVTPHGDGVLTGSRFLVAPDELVAARAGESAPHGHRHWSELREGLSRIEGLPASVRDVAVGVFELLAWAEAAVHGVAVEEVAFHEVGAWDSVADIVAAATLIDGLGPVRWSVGPLPRGRGAVETAHGALPAPAPAAAKLLLGFTLMDDGEEGERVTPTGAALLRWLRVVQTPDPTPRRLCAVGIGFGARRLKGRSNILRASLYDGGEAGGFTGLGADVVEALSFEIDDQTPEDISIALDHLRAASGVLDICCWPVNGKKGRSAMAVRMLVQPEAAEEVIAAVFHETATLGVRRTLERRVVVPRRMMEAGGVRVKRADRPSGVTFKAESDDIAGISGWRARAQARHAAERAAEAEEDEA